MESAGATHRAAVVIPIVVDKPSAVLFIKRAAHLRRNAGHVAFPGGLVDEADRDDLRITALREFEEELGVPATRLEIVGRLPDALVINRSVLVRPFVGVLDGLPETDVDRDEVAEVFTVPLPDILSPGALHEGIEVLGDVRHPTWQLDWRGIHIWGATARMLRSLVVTAREDPTLRAALARRGVVFARFRRRPPPRRSGTSRTRPS